MTLKETMAALEAFGSEQTRKIYSNHGIEGEFYGVKVQDMKTLKKQIKKDHDLSLKLYNTGNADAQYFASMIADEKNVTKTELNHWAKTSSWHMVGEYAVPWLAADSGMGLDLGLKWIKNKNAKIAATGWATLCSVLSVTPNETLDKSQFQDLLKQVAFEVHSAPNRVKYTMNNFVIAVGTYFNELTKEAKKIGEKIGKVEVHMGNTACKVPLAAEYIQKNIDKGRIGKKKKIARC